MRISRWLYYISSLPTLAVGIRNWPAILAALAGGPARRPFDVILRGGLRFKARTLLDVWIIKETCLDEGYERASLRLGDGWTILDIGAGLGDFTVDAARKNPHGTVYAYEPSAESFALLQQNLALNGVTNACVFRAAVAAEAGRLLLDTSVPEAVMYRTAAPATAGQVVEALSLDQVFDEHGLKRCDFVKMDCEGAEYDILFHASPETLHRIGHICLEYHDGVTAYSHRDLITFFMSHGFAVTAYPNPAHSAIGLLHAARQ